MGRWGGQLLRGTPALAAPARARRSTVRADAAAARGLVPLVVVVPGLGPGERGAWGTGVLTDRERHASRRLKMQLWMSSFTVQEKHKKQSFTVPCSPKPKYR
jgi:hypothetical protein